jgi:hypothetical protein
VNDVYQSAEFQSLHTLQRRLAAGRRAHAHEYEDLIAGLGSFREAPRRRRLRFRRGRPRLARA